jgi:hypothetical protein
MIPALPNLFSFATSELSQDAILAYILSWADCSHAKSAEQLSSHHLGERLLRRLVREAAEAQGLPDPLHRRVGLQAVVRTQVNFVDILVSIDDDLVLVIEDKTGTKEHGSQIKAYVENVKAKSPHKTVLATFIKTRPESVASLEGLSFNCGTMLRADLLKELKRDEPTGNDIIDEFRKYLEQGESRCQQFQSKPVDCWSGDAIEGFYQALEQRLLNEGMMKYGGWGYVNNRSGGFHGFWCCFAWSHALECDLYLQVHDARRLTLRAARFESGKVDSAVLYSVLEAAEQLASVDTPKRITVSKAGRFHGGESAAVAVLGFGTSSDNFPAQTSAGLADLGATVGLLKKAVVLLNRIVEKLDG